MAGQASRKSKALQHEPWHIGKGTPVKVMAACAARIAQQAADRVHRSSRTDWFPAFLEMFPSRHTISAMTKEEFTGAAWEVAGHKVEKSLMLSDICETAKAAGVAGVTRRSYFTSLRNCNRKILPKAAFM